MLEEMNEVRESLTESSDRLVSKGMRYLIPEKLAFIAMEPEMLPQFQREMLALGATCVASDLPNEYSPLRTDFGPVSLGVVSRFCRSLAHKLASLKTGYFCEEQKSYVCNKAGALIYCMDPEPSSLANSCFLLGAFLMFQFGFSAQEASIPFMGKSSPVELQPFRDASGEEVSDTITLLDCLSGLSKAVDNGWFDFRNFDLETYEALDNFSGDIHQICPKFIAFKGPRADLEEGEHNFVSEATQIVEIFLQLRVSCVVRLNESTSYDKMFFSLANITHHDLHIEGDLPTDDAVEKFLTICDQQVLVAVHCSNGLGRTGTMIAIWLMRRKKFTAKEAIAWIRIVRSGSIIGQQQEYLMHCEKRLWVGNRFSTLKTQLPDLTPWPARREPSPCRPTEDYSEDSEDEEDVTEDAEVEKGSDVLDEAVDPPREDADPESAAQEAQPSPSDNSSSPTGDTATRVRRNSGSILSRRRSDASRQGIRVRWKG